MRAALALACLLPVAAAANAPAEPVLPALDVRYDVSWNGIALGEARITLQPGERPGCYRYESLTEPVGLVKMFYGKPRDTSTFCIRGGKVVPERFAFHNPKDRDDAFTLEFDMAAGTVRGPGDTVRKVPPDAQDRFGMQQAVRLWVLEHLEAKDPGTVTFTLVDDRRVKPYRFAITGREKVTLGKRTVEAIVVERVDDPRKSTKFWLSPAHAHMPVRMEQIRDGDPELKMVLKTGG